MDYLEANPLNNAGDANATYASRGKRQPYAAHFKRNDATSLAPAADSPVAEQTLVAPDPPPKTVNTFGLANTPLRRLGQPEDLVGAAVFLASEASAFVTGQVQLVDGGFGCGLNWPIDFDNQ